MAFLGVLNVVFFSSFCLRTNTIRIVGILLSNNTYSKCAYTYKVYTNNVEDRPGRRKERDAVMGTKSRGRMEERVKALRNNNLLCVGGCVHFSCVYTLGVKVHTCTWTDERFYWCRQMKLFQTRIYWRSVHSNGSRSRRQLLSEDLLYILLLCVC